MPGLRLIAALVAALLGFSVLSPAQNIITTVAGSTWIFRGDGGPATNAPLGRTAGVAVDTAGNIFAADQLNCLVVKISPSGVLTVVAGNGICGFSGDGGPAAGASLNEPRSVALDSAGNLYIADFYNDRLRRMSPSGIITTVAGNGQKGFSGDGGPATSASLYGPAGVAVDGAGNVFVADRVNERVRKIMPGGTISTIAGNGSWGSSGDGGPATGASLAFFEGTAAVGLAVDAAGNLYIAEYASCLVRKVNPGGTISTLAGRPGCGAFGDGGPATSALLSGPQGLAVDMAGNLYIADSENNRVRKVTPAGIISTVAGSGAPGFSGDGGPATAASLYGPSGVASDRAGNLYIADWNNKRVRKVSAGGNMTTLAGNGVYKFSGDGGPAVAASLNGPWGAAPDGAGNVYFADTDNNRIRKISPAGIITTVAGNGTAGFSGDGGPATAASLNRPAGLAVDSAGDLYIADQYNSCVRRVSAGMITTLTQINYPKGVAVDTAGNLYIANGGNQVWRFSAGGISVVAGNGSTGSSGDGGPATSAAVNFVIGVVVDRAGNLYLIEAFGTIRKVNSSGIITTLSCRFNMPRGGAVDAGGNLYIADTLNHRVSRVSADGPVVTVAGSGIQGYSGDGGGATTAALSEPSAVALDVAGNLYIADSKNDRIRKVLAAAPSLSVSRQTLAFSAGAGAAGAAAQQVTLSGAVAGLAWQATARTISGGNWLSVSPASGQVPATVSVSVNASNVAAGTYQGAIDISAPGASPSTTTVAVTLTVTAVQPASLAVQPTSLSFRSAAGGAAPAAQSLSIANAGGGTLSWTAQVSSGGAWLSVSPTAGSASPGLASIVQVTAKTSGLTAGNYGGSITISSPTTNQTQTVAVSLSVTQANQRLLVGQSGFFFTGVEGGTIVPPQAIGILNVGQGVMNWTIERSTASGGNWLTVSAATGSSDAASTKYPKVDIGVNVSGMRTGLYHGEIVVSAPGADNPRQVLPVDLNVLQPGSNPGLLIRPTGLIFVRQAGTSDPNSDGVDLTTAAPAGFEVHVSPSTFDGGNWLGGVPDNATITPADPWKITVPVKLGSFSPGVYFGTLSIKSRDVAGGSFDSQEVQVLFIVTRGGGTSTASLHGREAEQAAAYGDGPGQNDADVCTPQRLVAVHRTLANNFSAPNGYPSLIEAQVKDDCGQEVTKATVLATFTNGDPVLILTHLSGGTYVGTWVPASKSAVEVTVRATMPPLTEATSKAFGNTGDVRPASAAGGGPFEPQLTRFLNPGFYILEATLAPGAAAGFWGLEVLTSVGQAAGGFNLGGALPPSSSNTPGFGAFMLSTPQTVTANLNAQAPAGTSLTMRFLDSSKKLIGNPVSGPPPLQLGVPLSAGFYIVEVYNGAVSAVTYQLGLAADFFSGGVDTGGYLTSGIVGFGGFYVPVAQNVTMKLFGQNTYGSAGAGSMVLTLKDSNRQVIQTIGP